MSIAGRITRWMTAAVIAVMLFFCAAGAEEPALRAGCPSRSPETVVSQGRNLYIPGNWDLSRMTLELGKFEAVRLEKDGPDIRPGEETDLTAYAGGELTLYNGQGKILTVHLRRGSEIPSLFLTVDSGMLGKIRKNKNMEIPEGRAVYAEADGTAAYDGAITQMKGRGNNTFSYPKKPWQIKLAGKASLSGMAGAKTWVLLANWNDVSLLRNQIVLDMCRAAGLRYALGCAPADVWINGEYQGLYLLAEKPQIKKGRMALRDLEDETEALNTAPMDDSLTMRKASSKELPLMRWYEIENNPEDITGGYLFTIEKAARFRDYALPGFRTRDGLNIQIKEPTFPGKEQAEYLGGLVSEMHRAVIAGDGVHPETGKHYTEYIDMDSFALKYLVEEWCKNYDYIGGSQYLYKDSDTRDPLIYAGPAWDYDLSFGNMGDRGYSPKGNYITSLSRRPSSLYWLLSLHGDFMDRVRETWAGRFRPAAAVLLGEKAPGEDSVIRPLDEYAARIRDSAEMNFIRWGIPGTTVREAGGSFAHACEYLKNWIAARTAFMDGEY